MVAALVDGGADIRAINNYGETPLHRAVISGEPSIVATLLDRGADPSAGQGSPLVMAVRRGEAALVQLFLDRGADIATRSHGQTLLHAALDAPDGPAMARLLLDRGADIEAVHKDAFRQTPLHWAVSLGHAGMVEFLLERGANVLAEDSLGANILGSALNSTPEVMQVLIQRRVLAAYDPAVASDLCYSAAVFSGAPAALLKEHCDKTGVVAMSQQAQEALDGSDLLPEHPWAGDVEPRSNEYFAVADLRDLADSHPRAFEIVRQFALLADGITGVEGDAIDILRQIIERFPAGDASLLDALSRTWWRLTEDITWPEVVEPLAFALEAGSPQAFLEALRNRPPWVSQQEPTPTPTRTPPPGATPIPPTATPTPAAVGGPGDLPWVRDGLTEIEREALGYLQDIQRRIQLLSGSNALFAEVLETPWLADGINEGERRLLCLVATQPDPGTAYALFVTTAPAPDLPACP